MEPKDILIKARTGRGFTQEELAERLHISTRTYQRYEEGLFPKFKTELILSIDKLLGTTLYDIIYDINKPKSFTTQIVEEPEPTYLTKRRNLKNTVSEFRVPLVSVKARAGYVNSYDQVDLLNSLDKYAIPPGVSYVGAIWRYFEVDGDSMEPTLSSGDYVLCSQVPQDDWPNVSDFYVHVLVTETALMIKRVFKKSDALWVLISDNESHTPQKLFEVEKLKELWVFRRLIKKTISPKKKFEIKL